eukprot:Gregarina_sp_Pseudo_9__271@NODE_1173_length_1813_cov_120_127396_g1099_i0_p2_GENE_NODE_1173_length_1813_cov_120_127396_g1099_i0NODE_1173_length_1813_cov_120_127396_g1099_i0_p2_ORF_typecomplete_len127_score2_68Asp/PF00026_23/8_8e09TAXi_C/PF14541_6/0_084_NODE_1173_length_1813_cov_120_127396_g1099_i014321785
MSPRPPTHTAWHINKIVPQHPVTYADTHTYTYTRIHTHGITHPRAGELVEFPMTPEDYMLLDRTSGTECLFGMAPLDVPPPSGPLVVLGVNFLQKYLSIFDFGTRTRTQPISVESSC